MLFRSTEFICPTTQDLIGPTEWISEDGSRIVSSINIAKDISGFAAPTPVNIKIIDDKISKIEVLKNNETPEFWNSVLGSGLLLKWEGLTIKDALNVHVDVISGATMSSLALIKTIKRTMEYVESVEPQYRFEWIEWKTIIGILVIISGVILSFIKPKNKYWRYMQLILNTIVLGFWCGSFLSLSLFTNWIANGINLSFAILSVCLLIVVAIMPFFGKKATYCTWHCPMGSLQELIGKVGKFKLSVSQKILKLLIKLRECLFMILLFMMWIGVGFELMNYEVFTFFLFQQASIVEIGRAHV